MSKAKELARWKECRKIMKNTKLTHILVRQRVSTDEIRPIYRATLCKTIYGLSMFYWSTEWHKIGDISQIAPKLNIVNEANMFSFEYLKENELC